MCHAAIAGRNATPSACRKPEILSGNPENQSQIFHTATNWQVHLLGALCGGIAAIAALSFTAAAIRTIVVEMSRILTTGALFTAPSSCMHRGISGVATFPRRGSPAMPNPQPHL
jgi:hypothetical protein